MLISPKFPNVSEDTRLSCLKTEADKLRKTIDDIEWHGGNAAMLKARWYALNQKVLAGVRYEPKF